MMRKGFVWIISFLLLCGAMTGCRKNTPSVIASPSPVSATMQPTASAAPTDSASPDATEEPVMEGSYREQEITYPSRGVQVHATVVLPGSSLMGAGSSTAGTLPDAVGSPAASTSPDTAQSPVGTAGTDGEMHAMSAPDASASPDAVQSPVGTAGTDGEMHTLTSPDASASPDAAQSPYGTAGTDGNMHALTSPDATTPVEPQDADASQNPSAQPTENNMPEGGYPMVVFLHGHGGERNENGGYRTIAHMLASRGIASIRMDFAGSGDSEEPFTENSLTSMYTDALAAIDFMKSSYPIDENAIGVFGFDMGGRVALHLMAQKLFDFRAAVLLAPANSNADWIDLFGGQEAWDKYKADAELNNYTTFTTLYGQVQDLSIQWFSELEASDDPAQLAEQSVHNPALVIYATNDTTVSPEVSRYVADKLGAETLVLESGGHSYGFYAESETLLDRIGSAAASFFARTLGTDSAGQS